jgi:hypothetical protein
MEKKAWIRSPTASHSLPPHLDNETLAACCILSAQRLWARQSLKRTSDAEEQDAEGEDG